MTELEDPPAEPARQGVLAVERRRLAREDARERRERATSLRPPGGLTPDEMVTGVLSKTKDWEFGAVSVGVPLRSSPAVSCASR